VIVRRARGIWGLWGGVTIAVLLALLALAAAASADSIAIQPDGKIVLAGSIWPQAGALASLEPDGTVDEDFGRAGFVIDRRLPPFQALALDSDGRILAVPVGGLHPARYLPDGAPDPTFAGAGAAEERGQPVQPSVRIGPTAVVLPPDGSVVVAENRTMPAVQSEAWIKRYGGDGTVVGAGAGHIARPGRASSTWINDLLQQPDGSLLGAGSLLDVSGESALLARFLPSSGSDYDPGFGGGAGLVRLDAPPEDGSQASFGALAWDGDKIVAAGRAGDRFLAARFAADGTLDPAFGDGGHTALPIAGPSAGVAEAASWAADVAPLGAGELLLSGGTSEWSKWVPGKLGALYCSSCPQPLLAMVDATGELVPGFGSNGVLRLLRPDGSDLQGAVEQAVPLDDGKILVRGSSNSGLGIVGIPFLARLNRDGSYDPTFGEGGLTVVRFPCTNQPRPERKRAGCVGQLRARIALGGVRQGHPALLLRARSTPGWTAISDLTLTLPKYLRLTHDFRSRLKVRGGGADVKVRITAPRPQKPYTVVSFSKVGLSRQLRVRFERGALRVRAGLPRRGLAFKLRAHFLDARWATWAGHDEITRRAE
jgi:uncharacterized delta-60 repeat protein